ncbi:hypothetical protein M3D15_04560 [Pseudoclavibacter alba]|uniref:Phage tail protein n=1 Tax=Pseudoclavibacter albus TaxID=272241 RepID=A0ABT2HWB2_9MICO|nr:hypothetical protein [Pseudoclavibacter alba]MCT2042607.1 hypothetical protein [Pseudoclavibacter alba]
MAISNAGAPLGVVAPSHGLILIGKLDAIKDIKAPTLAELQAETMIDFTYTIKTFDRKSTQEFIEDERWTLAQPLKYPGMKSTEISINYAFSNDRTDEVAKLDEFLVENEQYVMVVRSAIAKEEPLKADQLVDVIPFTCGAKIKDAPTNNAVWTKTVQLGAGDIQDDVKIVAGAAA